MDTCIFIYNVFRINIPLREQCRPLSDRLGALVAQWVKCWPTDLADRVRSSLEVKSSQS